eukprot:TRINITY_DN147_c0_g2_i1.p1 TRINITY_DN147_c0_g2~~TRINITY_DN147_c0_g2_i1.p1  ORF type:complete len:353 (-),score=43.12 TRINITY_DN147_c0_g2_i1:58-1116(-)
MVVLNRLRYLQQLAIAGIPMRIILSPSADLLKQKVRIIYKNDHEKLPNVTCQFASLELLNMLVQNIESIVSVDRGHKHSDGSCEVCLWMRFHVVRAETDAEMGCLLDPQAQEFVPDSLGHSGRVTSHGSTPLSLQGQWEALPASEWEVIHKRFQYCAAADTLKSHCSIASRVVETIPDLRRVSLHCSGTSWGRGFLDLLTVTEEKYCFIRDLPHSREQLFLNHLLIFEVFELSSECMERCELLKDLIACYPKTDFTKRYRFLKPVDTTLYHYPSEVFVDVLMNLPQNSQEYWMNQLHERFWSSHSWCSMQEVTRLHPLDLIQGLRPSDRLRIDNAVFEIAGFRFFDVDDMTS